MVTVHGQKRHPPPRTPRAPSVAKAFESVYSLATLAVDAVERDKFVNGYWEKMSSLKGAVSSARGCECACPP